MLADRLELKPADYSQFGVIFDIRELDPPDKPAAEHRRATPRARRLDAPELLEEVWKKTRFNDGIMNLPGRCAA